MTLMSEEEFSFCVDKLPLISIDICLVDTHKRVLVGERKNDPAKGFLFTPGGRIRKGETLKEATFRILYKELGCDEGYSKKLFSNLIPMGAFSHFYKDSAFSSEISTHYINLPYYATVSKYDFETNFVLPYDEHSEWFWVDEFNRNIHQYAEVYVKMLQKVLKK